MYPGAKGVVDMELSTVERAVPPRPQAQGVALPAVARPLLSGSPDGGVVNNIDPKLQVLAAGMAQEPAPAPVQANDNTVTPVRSATPHEPLSKMLMAHFHSMWSASARVVDQAQVSGADKNLLHMQEAANKQAQNRNLDPAAVPGTLARTELTYSPGKIKKIDAT